MPLRRIALVLAALFTIALIAVPDRLPDVAGDRLVRLDGVARLGGFLGDVEVPRAPPGGAALCQAIARDPITGAERLEARIAALRFGGDPIAPRVALAGRLWNPMVVIPSSVAPVSLESLPLRAPATLGPRGIDLLRVSAENHHAFGAEVAGALGDLAATVDVLHAAYASREDGGVDRDGASLGLVILSEAVDRVLPVLRRARASGLFSTRPTLPDGAGIPRGLLLVSEIDAGLVVIGGAGQTVLPMGGVALAIDVGGDDRWLGGVALGGADSDSAGAARPRIRVVIDLDGRDRYQGDGRTFAATSRGLSLLVDESGDDTYECEGAALPSAGPGGAAVLIDRAGDDSYVAGGGLGFGNGGLAVLFEDGGDDRYEIGGPGLGSAENGGCGLVLEAWGTDLVWALGRLPDPGRDAVRVLGAALSGGLGVWLDRRGNDVHRVASCAGGFAADGAVGVFLDAAGDDTSSFGTDALGAASSGGFAVYRDLDGSDRVLARSRSLGYADEAIAFYLDDSGDDDRRATGPFGGASIGAGAAVFADLGGR